MHVTVHRKTLLSLPSAYGAHTPIEIGGDLLPRLETVPRRVSQRFLPHDVAKEGQSGPPMHWPSMTLAGPPGPT